MSKTRDITVTVNGEAFAAAVEPRLLLADFLRHTLGLTGTHVGCEHGVCGACTVLLDGDSARLRAHGDIQEFYLGQSQGGARASYRAVKQYRRSRRWYG